MRIPHCTVALAVAVLVAGAAQGQTGAPAQADYAVFLQGVPIGREQVTVTRGPDGITISGTEQIGEPLSIVTRRAEVRYSSDWRPLECIVEGSLKNEQVLLHTTVSGTTASSAVTQGTTNAQVSHEVAPTALLLPNMFFGAYQALASRLVGAKPGDKVPAYVPPVAPMVVTVKSVAEERVRTLESVIAVRRFMLDLARAGNPGEVELWIDSDGRLLRFSVLAQAFDVVRTDVASITARREQSSRPNDETVQVPAYGFSLAGTLSRPTATVTTKNYRYPAVVLVGGSGPSDRDETLSGIPVFGGLASALADAGFLVLRYDKRGVGQSGGRPESTTLSDFAEDAVWAAKYLLKRKDVNPKQVAMVGYGEGGAIAVTAASRSKDIAALVLLAAPGTTGSDLVLEQQRHLLSLMNLSDAERQAKIDMQVKLHKAVIAGHGFEGIPSAVRRQADTPWFQSFLVFDPAKTIKKVDQPILIVHGERDTQIEPANADKLAALAKARKGRAGLHVKLVKVPDMNHLLVPSTTGEVDEYDRLTGRTISPAAVSAIQSWLQETMVRAR